VAILLEAGTAHEHAPILDDITLEEALEVAAGHGGRAVHQRPDERQLDCPSSKFLGVACRKGVAIVRVDDPTFDVQVEVIHPTVIARPADAPYLLLEQRIRPSRDNTLAVALSERPIQRLGDAELFLEGLLEYVFPAVRWSTAEQA
jgi:hypothetical protein